MAKLERKTKPVLALTKNFERKQPKIVAKRQYTPNRQCKIAKLRTCDKEDTLDWIRARPSQK